MKYSKDFSPTKHVMSSLMKVVVVFAIMLVLFALGMMIGYGIIGNGKTLEVFKAETWKHIFDFLRT